MKNIMRNIIVVFSLFSSVFFSSCSTPGDYCESMVALCTEIEADLSNLSDAISAKDYQKAEDVYNQNLQSIEKTIEKINVKGDYNGQSKLYEAALKFANTYKDIYQNEYKTCIDILKKENHTYADGDSLAMMMDGLDKKYISARHDLVVAFKEFVAENDLSVSSY